MIISEDVQSVCPNSPNKKCSIFLNLLLIKLLIWKKLNYFCIDKVQFLRWDFKSKPGLCVCLDPSKAQVKTWVLDGLESWGFLSLRLESLAADDCCIGYCCYYLYCYNMLARIFFNWKVHCWTKNHAWDHQTNQRYT